MNGELATYQDVLRDILQEYKLPYPENSVHQLYKSRIDEKKNHFQAISSEVMAMLDYLKENGYKIALISNCTEEEIQGWADSELSPYFCEVIFSYEIRMAKPDVRIYHEACRRLSISHEQALFVGDGGSSELSGAEQAGLQVAHAQWFNRYITSPYDKYDSPLALIERLSSSKLDSE